MASNLWKQLSASLLGKNQTDPEAVQRDSEEGHTPAPDQTQEKATMPESTGKLKQPTRQRRLPRERLSRENPYDLPTPGKIPLRPVSSKHQEQDFSPRKRNRKNTGRDVADEGVADSANVRRSPRKRDHDNFDPAPEASGMAKRKSVRTSARGIPDEEVAQDDEASEVDEVSVSKNTPTADALQAQVSTPGKRGPGRPRKTPATESREATEEQSAILPQHSSLDRLEQSSAAQHQDPDARDEESTGANDKPIPTKLKHRLKAKAQRPENVRRSQVRFSTDLAETGDDDQEDAEAGASEPRRDRHQTAGARRSKAQKSTEADGSGSKSRNVRPEGSNARRARAAQPDVAKYAHLYQRWPDLEDIMHHTKRIGVSFVKAGSQQTRVEFELTDYHVKKMMRRSVKLEEKLESMKSAAETEDDIPDASPEFDSIKRGIDVLCGRVPDTQRPIDLKDNGTATEIYFHLFPKLIHLLCFMLEFFEDTDEGDRIPEFSLSSDSALRIAEFIGWMRELWDGAAKYERPDSRDAVIRDLRSIMPKLGQMRNTLRQKAHDHQERQHRRARLVQQIAKREAERRAEEQQEAVRARWKVLEDKWYDLHDKRRCYEGCIISPKKREYLADPPEHEHELDYDFHGQEFERLQMFHKRVGPSKIAVDRVLAKGPWPEESVAALCDGLQKYAGDPKVFTRIFWDSCGKHGPLNAYSVTEIVVWSAVFKEKWMDEQGDDVEDWVRQIPNWLKPQSLPEPVQGAEVL